MLLRPFQAEALQRLQSPTHLLCISPTGSGKSLIYEKIAAENGRRTLLITPLVALARQQAERLRQNGVSAAFRRDPPDTGVWILSPESLRSMRIRQNLQRWRPDFLVVDECHCLYDWGESFRTAFMDVPELLRKLAIPRSLWLTATLPPAALRELKTLIGEPLTIIGKFSLPQNLQLSIQRAPWTVRATALLEQSAREREPGIIFVTTREATHRVCRLLEASGRRAVPYHAGMSAEERCGIERTLREKSDAILVATSAFGMGMDFAHLRWSVLWQPPSSLLALAQAVGRIGRNSDFPGRASVFWDDEDFRYLQWMAGKSLRRRQDLEDLGAYCKRSGCRTSGLEAYFNSSTLTLAPCGRCDHCVAT